MASGAKAFSWEEADRLLLIYVRFVNKRLYVRTKEGAALKPSFFIFSIVMLISSTVSKDIVSTLKRYSRS